ncbi:hypothetical protein ACVW1A_003122 [Bradyrhizobium sp. LB1.3]
MATLSRCASVRASSSAQVHGKPGYRDRHLARWIDYQSPRPYVTHDRVQAVSRFPTRRSGRAAVIDCSSLSYGWLA